MRSIPYKLILIASLICGCSQSPDCNKLLAWIYNDFSAGNLKEVIILADSLKAQCPGKTLLVSIADSLSQIAARISLDFSLTENEVIAKLQNNQGKFSKEELAAWEDAGWLEYRIIDGEKRYFNRAASNLGLIKSFHLQREKRDSLIGSDPRILFRKQHTGSIIAASGNSSVPVTPVEMNITYTITVSADAVPAGETVRCWLPWPKEGNQRQKDIKLTATSQESYEIASDTAINRSIYMEAKMEKQLPLIFSVSYSYQSSGQYFDPATLIAKPYDKSSDLYIKNTSEQVPQICFTENIKRIADSICGPEKDPKEIVRKVYYWFNRNIPWAGALEYSIMANIPEYVIKNKRGDCGMQTFLFMSMLRYKGVPVKWQSGWMMPPDAENLHDWCEVYYEGTGWVPVDISYNLQYSDKQQVSEFYISGIDSYRLIVNDGISGPLHPAKRFMRSEPYDFQRGEVEWAGGNLYFNKWDYDMKIEYGQK